MVRFPYRGPNNFPALSLSSLFFFLGGTDQLMLRFLLLTLDRSPLGRPWNFNRLPSAALL